MHCSVPTTTLSIVLLLSQPCSLSQPTTCSTKHLPCLPTIVYLLVPSNLTGAGTHVGFGAVVGGSVVPSDAAKLDLYINDTLYGVKQGLPFGASLQCVEGQEGTYSLLLASGSCSDCAGREVPSCGPPDSVGPTADGVMASMFWVPPNASQRMPGCVCYCFHGNFGCGSLLL